LLTQQDWTGTVESSTELTGLQTFGGLVMVPTHQQQVISLDVALPATVVSTQANGVVDYRLRLRKQPGLDTLPVNIEVRLPEGARLLPGTSAASSSSSSSWTWQGSLTQTMDFVVRFSTQASQ
jgi:hypothetical protein